MDEDITESVFGVVERLQETAVQILMSVTSSELDAVAERLEYEIEIIRSNARTLKMREEFKAARP